MPDTDLAWLCPVLARPHRVKPLLDAIAASTPGCEVWFVTDPDDAEEHAAIQAGIAGSDLDVRPLIRGGTWAFKLNEAVRERAAPLVFLGADDLEPARGWLEQAEAKLSPAVQVVGVNDGIRRRKRTHSTHFLMAREYALEPLLDGSRGPAPECYAHNWADDEIVATALKRGAYAYAGAAHVTHFHPLAQRSQRVEDDDTYRKGRARFHRDKKTFEKRSHLWT